VVTFPPFSPSHSLSSPIRATCPAHLILLDFITHRCWMRSTEHLFLCYAISFSPLLPRPS
jgi:hypothetical protein